MIVRNNGSFHLLMLGAALCLGLAAATPAHAGKQDFTLLNKTGYQIDEVYVSPSRASHWGSDVMGRDTLDDGQKVDITFDHGNACHFDLQVKYNDGDKAEWSDLNLCEVSAVTLFWDRKNQTTRAVTE